MRYAEHVRRAEAWLITAHAALGTDAPGPLFTSIDAAAHECIDLRAHVREACMVDPDGGLHVEDVREARERARDVRQALGCILRAWTKGDDASRPTWAAPVQLARRDLLLAQDLAFAAVARIDAEPDA
jgi:hypothetical protein